MPIGKARMSKTYLGKGKTRPIPYDVFTDDLREEGRNAAQTSLRQAPQFNAGRKINAPQVSGRISQRVKRGNGFNPAQSNTKFK